MSPEDIVGVVSALEAIQVELAGIFFVLLALLVFKDMGGR